ncbi:tRNA uridine-5-carboxymethylaminomethyl(34) synthesis GTPase MnmE [Candidatus Erwinia haradaeae]|uniref:tRNA modification GTPase MnmE n=1 Tax=Candidatus Erwinia haradaeae TaxID=1922217 RepID=A0A451D4L8_9GAMM|nr:tRNA uridine-5-carboxymethylaminomethyl(34) synthesis GTPase MnmE [Candidatus Erwinia haradaeae]VFP80641.1 tRNA modification GTPase MnmE [Candidatus Erwinia haradaeae]
MKYSNTIVAEATPPGRGSVGILRISGNQAASVAWKVLKKLPQARYAEYLVFYDQDDCVLDKGIALWFPAPYSFTGEDVLELQGHGGPIILDLLLKNILLVPGLRIANPGEFSERAFLNNKLDLIQAEAISDLITADSEQAARSAACSLQGLFSKHIKNLSDALTRLRIEVEKMINFPDEKINSIIDCKIESQLYQLISQLDCVSKEAHLGNLLREGRKVVIAGQPNAGKSSLLNRLSGRQSAIVTDVEGTTRDTLHEYIYIDGMPFHIVDTAGLRDTRDKIERIGIERAWNEIKQADHILFVVDGATTHSTDLFEIWPDLSIQLDRVPPFTIIRNKADITGESQEIVQIHGGSLICLSARTGVGIKDLLNHLRVSMIGSEAIEGRFFARRRHIQALELTAIHLQNCQNNLREKLAGEILAEDLRLAHKALGEITGEFSSNDLLGSIFSSFCIGK